MLIACQSVDVNLEKVFPPRYIQALRKIAELIWLCIYIVSCVGLKVQLSTEYSCGKRSKPEETIFTFDHLCWIFENRFCSDDFSVFYFLFHASFPHSLASSCAKVLLITSIFSLSCGPLCCTNCANRWKSNFLRCTISTLQQWFCLGRVCQHYLCTCLWNDAQSGWVLIDHLRQSFHEPIFAD